MSAPSHRPIAPGDHVFLVDGSSYIFRAYHALPPLTRKSDGTPVGAVAGFCNMLWRLLRETGASERPTHLAVIFDHSGKTFRSDIYPAYKEHRPEPPEDLRPQFALIREATRAFNVPAIEQQGYEADDLIATYTRLATDAGATAIIIASDKDLMQLVRPGVSMLDTMKDKRIGPEEVFEKFGVAPDKVVDVQSLSGDSVDNVPGVPGIGIKTAAQLISEYGDLEGLLARAHEIKQPKRRESLIQFAEQARISRQLVRLEDQVPVTTPLEALELHEIDGPKLVAFCKMMEFTGLTRRIATALDLDAGAVDAAPVAQPGKAVEAAATPVMDGDGIGPSPAQLAALESARIASLPVNIDGYTHISSVDQLQEWISEAYAAGIVAVDTETNALDATHADLIGISLATAPGRACYIPLGHRAGEGLFGAEPVEGQAALKDVIAALKPLLEAPAVLKVGQNLKYDWAVLTRYGIDVGPHEDTMLMSYVLDAGRGTHGMDDLSERWLGHRPIPFKDVTAAQKGANKDFSLVPIAEAVRYAAEDADITLRLYHIFRLRLVAEGMCTVYETLERPLVPILARMEGRGIAIDRHKLSRMSGEFAQSMGGLEAEIQTLAGEPFNPASPRQLGEILFGKMALPGGKKTASGQWATGADVLEDLAAEGHELPARILAWRQLAKLKSTYTDALPTYARGPQERVHTSFSLAATTTGRLSSSEPNIQNIPVRTAEGRKIRTAFIAPEGCSLISADYSQIELRVLAHMADIPQLTRAFAEGIDIHAMTASEMFGVPVEGMPSEVRRRAKAINFGIIYGISAFGLANQLGISREEAGAYIKKYFERFPGIRDYMGATKASCRERGYVTTLFGRKCHYPGITSKNAAERAFVERQSINAPVQGTAADIIRRAMIRMEPALEAAGLKARMLLQVHDELVFEVPDSEIAPTIGLITRVMETAATPAVELKVPLKVEARAAANWDEAH